MDTNDTPRAPAPPVRQLFVGVFDLDYGNSAGYLAEVFRLAKARRRWYEAQQQPGQYVLQVVRFGGMSVTRHETVDELLSAIDAAVESANGEGIEPGARQLQYIVEPKLAEILVKRYKNVAPAPRSPPSDTH